VDRRDVTYIRRSDLLTRTIDGEAVILDSAGGKVHQLNASARVIWEGCDGTHSADAIAHRVAAEFGTDAAIVLLDVQTMLEALHGLGLLVRIGD
jgi:hypothetical protein